MGNTLIKEKQIEEMAKITCLCNACGICECDGEPCDLDCSEGKAMERLYNAGYRKASEVAREIFERLHAHRKNDGHTVSVWINDLICIAKEYGIDLEKYTEEGK